MTPLKLTVVCHEKRNLSTRFGNGGWKNETAEMQTQIRHKKKKDAKITYHRHKLLKDQWSILADVLLALLKK